MSDAVQAVKVERIVVRVGAQEVALTVEEARELHRALGELVGPRDLAVVREREYVPYVPCPAPQVVPYVPWVIPGDTGGPIWWSPNWKVTCGDLPGTAVLTASSGSQG